MRDNDAIAAQGLRLALTALDENQSELARVCGCTQGAVWQMLNKAPPRLSAQYVLKVEAATGISRSMLRPDFYPEASADREPLVARVG